MSTLDPQAPSPTGVAPGAHCALHPDRPADFTCSRCGNFACGECKTPGDDGKLFCRACSAHAVETFPLDRVQELGFGTAMFKTLYGVLVTPWDFFNQRSPNGGLLVPTLFGALIHMPATVVYALINMLGAQNQLEELRSNPIFRNNPVFDSEVFQFMLSPGGQLTMMLVSSLIYPLYLLIFTVIEWGAMVVVGARDAGFKDYYRAICYLQATSLGMLVLAPFSLLLTFVAPQAAGVVMFPYLLYWVIWLIVALWKTGRTDLWRPVVAQVLLFTVCCCLPWILVFVAAFGVAASALR